MISVVLYVMESSMFVRNLLLTSKVFVLLLNCECWELSSALH